MSAKRDEILAAATERFGRDGYEHTKWADIAADVGVGPTALYHYFESKQHCLYVIMDAGDRGLPRALRDAHRRDSRDPSSALDAVMADCFDLSEHDVQRNRVLVAEQGLLVRPPAARRARRRRARPRGRARATSSSPGRASSPRDARRRDPGERPAPAHARDPRPLQQHLALVPAERASSRSTASPTSSPSAALAHDRRRAARRRRAGGRRHDVLRALLRGPRRARPALVARPRRRRRRVLDPVGRRRGPQEHASSSAAARSCARFIDAGDMRRLGALRRLVGDATATSSSRSARRAGTSGERIGTFLAVAQLDADGRMARYMVGALARDRLRPTDRGRCRSAEFIPVADGLIAGTRGRAAADRLGVPALRHRRPSRARRRARAARRRDVEERRLARARHAVDLDDPVLPPEVAALRGRAEEFEPYGVGYVELPGEVRVEARLTESDPARLRDRDADGADADPGARRADA